MNKMNMLLIFIGLCIILCGTANALSFNCTGNSDCQNVDLVFANRGYVAWSTDLPNTGQVLTAWNSSALYWANITAPNGSIGPAGANGTSVNMTNITNNNDGTYNWTFNTGYIYKTANLTGPIGITGNTGATGPSGLNGTNGLNGTDLSANVSALTIANNTVNGRIDNVNTTSNANNATVFIYINAEVLNHTNMLQSNYTLFQMFTNISGSNTSTNSIIVANNATMASFISAFVSNNTNTNSRIDNINGTNNANNITLKGLIDGNNATMSALASALKLNISGINLTLLGNASWFVSGTNTTLILNFNDHQYNVSFTDQTGSASPIIINYTGINTTTQPQNASNTSLLNGTIRLYNLSLTLQPNTFYDIKCELNIGSAAATTGQQLVINYTNSTSGVPINATISEWTWTKMATATSDESLTSYTPNGSNMISTGSSILTSTSTLKGFVQTNGNITTINYWLASEIAGSQVNITRGSNCISRKI